MSTDLISPTGSYGEAKAKERSKFLSGPAKMITSLSARRISFLLVAGRFFLSLQQVTRVDIPFYQNWQIWPLLE